MLKRFPAILPKLVPGMMETENPGRTRMSLDGLSVSYSHAHYKTLLQSCKSLVAWLYRFGKTVPKRPVFLRMASNLRHQAPRPGSSERSCDDWGITGGASAPTRPIIRVFFLLRTG